MMRQLAGQTGTALLRACKAMRDMMRQRTSVASAHAKNQVQHARLTTSPHKPISTREQPIMQNQNQTQGRTRHFPTLILALSFLWGATAAQTASGQSAEPINRITFNASSNPSRSPVIINWRDGNGNGILDSLNEIISTGGVCDAARPLTGLGGYNGSEGRWQGSGPLGGARIMRCGGTAYNNISNVRILNGAIPVPEITALTAGAGAASSITVDFSAPVTGFDAASDITVTGGTAAAPVQGADASTYTVAITPATVGTPVTVAIPAGAVRDAADLNDSAASNSNLLGLPNQPGLWTLNGASSTYQAQALDADPDASPPVTAIPAGAEIDIATQATLQGGDLVDTFNVAGNSTFNLYGNDGRP